VGDDDVAAAAKKMEWVSVFEEASNSDQAVGTDVIAHSEHAPSLLPVPLALTGHSAGPSTAHGQDDWAGTVVSVHLFLNAVLLGRVTLQMVEELQPRHPQAKHSASAHQTL
jgi:hypothetical protein